MRCRKALWFLSARCDGTLSERQRLRLEVHLASCQSCRRESFYFSELEYAQPHLLTAPVSEEFNLRLRAAVVRAEETVRPRTRFHWISTILRPVAVVAACAVVSAFAVSANLLDFGGQNDHPGVDLVRSRTGDILPASFEKSSAARYGNHSVLFYQNPIELSGAVVEFISAGLDAGAPVLIIATPEHRRKFTDDLASQGFDLTATIASGQLSLLDADDMLSGFMVEGNPEAEAFGSSVGNTVRQAIAARPNSQLRIYSEMVNLLWTQGRADAAVELEEVWEGLHRTSAFSRLCAYDMNALRGAGVDAFQEICEAHSHVVPSDDFSWTPGELDVLRELRPGTLVPVVGKSPESALLREAYLQQPESVIDAVQESPQVGK